MTGRAVELAAAQLAELEELSVGALKVLHRAAEGGRAEFVIVIETGVTGRGSGVRVRARERFRVRVSAGFPYEPPSVYAGHRRWRDCPHVNWGNLLCLYAAPSIEWVPADGMRGLVERLLIWLGRAAEGTLDPEDQPLHPPVAFPTATGCVVVEPNLGDHAPWSGAETGRVARRFAWCARDGDRIDVIRWLTTDQLVKRACVNDGSSTDSQGSPYFFVPTVMISDELWWEYPTKADELADGLSQAGYPREDLLADLTLTAQANQLLRGEATGRVDTDPVVVLVGTPSRRLAGTRRLAHLVAWKLDQYGTQLVDLLAGDAIGAYDQKTSERIQALAKSWLRTSEVKWIAVYDVRAETTLRRDQNTSMSWLLKRRVLILGCGALGAPVAEYCVRAGAAVTVVDNGYVTPGILVRQPYRYRDIGKGKATVLADRLRTTNRKSQACGVLADAIGYVLEELESDDFDLIVDATANAGVRAAIERVHRDHVVDGAPWPHTAMMIIGHKSDLGLVTVSRSEATGTGHDVLRRVLLSGRRTGARGWQEIVADFFSNPPRAEVFLPEPGCSAPTFVGSAADVSALAASMLAAAMRILAFEGDRAETMTASAVSRDGFAASMPPLAWLNDLVLVDEDTGYEVRVSAEAMAEIRAEVRRGARVRGAGVETGGMVLGAVDESTGIISVDLATGPPPDSQLSQAYFIHGTAGTQDLIDRHVHQTGRAMAFLGIWHTHPGGRARPSALDVEGMSALTNFTPGLRRALMMIVGGASETWDNWVAAAGMPDVYVRLVERDSHAVLTDSQPVEDQQKVPLGRHFPGGFAVPAAELVVRRRRRWFRWRRR